MKRLIQGLFLIFLTAATAFGQESNGNTEEEILSTLSNFHRSIIDNDLERASNILTEDARILESGGVETREEYLSHHFHSDGNFLRSVNREILDQKVYTAQNTAWVSTSSRMAGTYKERDLNLSSAELIVLVRKGTGWKISAVHWSTRSND